MNRIFLLPFFCLSLSAGALAQTTDPAKLDSITEQQKLAEEQASELTKKQEQIKKEIEDLQGKLVKATAQSRGFEKAEADARRNLKKLEQQEETTTAAIERDRLLTTDLLAVLQKIERKPPPALMVPAQNATDAARAAGLVVYLTHTLETKTALMKSQLAELAQLRAQMTKTREEIKTNANELNTRLRGIRNVISDKSDLNSQLDADRKQKIEEAKKLASEAQSLRELIRNFEERANDIAPRIKPRKGTLPNPQIKPRRGQPPPVYINSAGTRFADARGALPLPVFGTLAKAFGARLEGGGRSKGVRLKTDRNAQVVAPFSGRVEFSGHFNDDNVVILNVGNGYFIVMTGLGETFTQAGDTVQSGEPLGVMPGGSSKSTELFMEFRKDRASIDPTPWIGTALANNKG